MKLLYLSMLAFVVVSSTSFHIHKKLEAPPTIKKYITTPAVTLLPELKIDKNFPIFSAQGAIAIDLDSSVILYEKNGDLPLYPASTTKIMTALVAMEAYPDDYKFKVTIPKIPGQKMGLVWGEEIKAKDLLDGLLIYSANDAAELLAREYPGGRSAFISEMNRKARDLFMMNTNFVNPTGLDSEDHVSTVRDLARLADYSMKNKEFASIVATKNKIVTGNDGKIVHKLTNINQLLGEVDGVLGIKTGWTENARENLVTYVERDNKRIVIVILGSQDRFGETKELIEWIFQNYEWSRPQFSYSP